ncbi:hypothetical protein D3C81_2169220 [compost metagenome]
MIHLKIHKYAHHHGVDQDGIITRFEYSLLYPRIDDRRYHFKIVQLEFAKSLRDQHALL